MNPEQVTKVFEALGRIEQKIDSHVEHADLVSRRHEAALNDLYTKNNEQAKRWAHLRGGAAAMSAFLTAAVAYLGLDRYWN